MAVGNKNLPKTAIGKSTDRRYKLVTVMLEAKTFGSASVCRSFAGHRRTFASRSAQTRQGSTTNGAIVRLQKQHIEWPQVALDDGPASAVLARLALSDCRGSVGPVDVKVDVMSASLIGHSGSSTFRLSTTTAVSMSLTGSCFSSESAPRPFHYGIRERGGTIYCAALPSD